MGGIRAMHVYQFQGARDLAEELQAAGEDKRRRRQACRDAILDWLASIDAVSIRNVQLLTNMLANSRWGMWFAKPFTTGDIEDAAAWLHQQGLIDCATVGGVVTAQIACLTDDGLRCVEIFDSHADRYVQAQREAASQMQRSEQTFNFGPNSGIVQVARDNAHQVAQQSNGASAEHLRDLITGLAEMVRALVPDASGIREQEQNALAAAGDGAVDRSVVRRFGDWALATVRAGATAAVVPAVSSATTAMMLEAGRLTGHLG